MSLRDRWSRRWSVVLRWPGGNEIELGYSMTRRAALRVAEAKRCYDLLLDAPKAQIFVERVRRGPLR